MVYNLLITSLIEGVGGKFSRELGIDLTRGDPEVFKWFIASVLFGARIGERIAVRTYYEFERAGLLTVNEILAAGWDRLVEILDSGGYVRYDFKTATKFMELSQSLLKDYSGSIEKLHRRAANDRDLAQRMKELAKGIGDTTTNIFLREMRGVWKKANPLPQELVVIASYNLGFVSVLSSDDQEKANLLFTLQERWKKEKLEGWDLPDFEAALLRLAKDYCRKSKCRVCPIRGDFRVKCRKMTCMKAA